MIGLLTQCPMRSPLRVAVHSTSHWVLTGRRRVPRCVYGVQVKEAFRLQEAISTAFANEAFGDYNEKEFDDIATPEELFDWMQ